MHREVFEMRFKIGSFEHLTGIPRGSLRYYDKLELLQPQRDDINSYRYYDEEDFIRLVQIRQYNGFGIQLDKLPTYHNEVDCSEMLNIFSQTRAELERTIDMLNDRLARIKRHEMKLGAIARAEGISEPFQMSGIYRLFITDPEVANHKNTPEIVRRWMGHMPYTHSTIRIKLSDFQATSEGPLPVDIGLGLLKGYFHELGEELIPPIQYSPISMRVAYLVTTSDLHGMTKETFRPLLDHMAERNVMLLDDIFGWIVFITTKGKKPLYHISFHAAIG
jgi:DNA-binding transcriptional MerR regulator